MERLHFVCPSTGQDVDVGIDSELETLLRIRRNRVLARCPVCDNRHEWEVRNAELLLQAALTFAVNGAAVCLRFPIHLFRVAEGG